ncbi:grx7p [Saccharomyces arboricola H-6]|uniref:Grx7p n=1 Tax=Saccharomyces arboricola (strain H-6 / AS 2.3317 / CBS 10644) TaxID=1160507 RepID=J8LR30_SACAR|nr:grx7p [Saccharomyces arboricola H-6]
MAIVINKRNVRALVIATLLLVLVFLVVRNSNASVNQKIISDRPDSLVMFDEAGNAPGTPKPVSTVVAETQDKEVDEVHENNEEVKFDAAAEYEKILKESPIIVFSKSYCPYSKKLKDLLAESYTFSPSYYVFELDQHTHADELQDHIEKITGRRTVPNIIINGVSRGGSDDMVALHKNDKLLDSFKEWSNGTFTVEAALQSEST